MRRWLSALDPVMAGDVFAGGHDVESGPPERVFEDPQHETSKSFLVQAGR